MLDIVKQCFNMSSAQQWAVNVRIVFRFPDIRPIFSLQTSVGFSLPVLSSNLTFLRAHTVLSLKCEETETRMTITFLLFLGKLEIISKDSMSPSPLFSSTNGNTMHFFRIPHHSENCFLSYLNAFFLLIFFPLLAPPFYFLNIQVAYKLSEDFAKPYFHKC